MKIYLITGEPSGDLHASNLVSQIKKLDLSIKFRAWGGDNLINEDISIAKNINSISYMGLWSVIKNLFSIIKLFDFCKKDILKFNPDILILVDYPGFNLRIAKFAKKQGIKVYYYIPPKLWAWNKKRLHSLRKYVDEIIVIFPFEVDFYKKYNINVHYFGNPISDQISKSDNFTNYTSTKPIIVLVPGSRRQEISYMLPVFVKMSNHFKKFQFVIAATNNFSLEFYKSFIKSYDIDIVFNETYGILKKSYAAVVTSGTASLETAFFSVPQVVCYKTNWLTYFFAKKIIKIKYLSLVNIIMNKLVVKELIQTDFNEKKLCYEISKICELEKRENILEQYALLKSKIGNKGGSYELAKFIVK